MKTCSYCGYVDYRPIEKCPMCSKYYGHGGSCNPLAGTHIEISHDSEGELVEAIVTPMGSTEE